MQGLQRCWELGLLVFPLIKAPNFEAGSDLSHGDSLTLGLGTWECAEWEIDADVRESPPEPERKYFLCHHCGANPQTNLSRK